jgi:hypothetical protein
MEEYYKNNRERIRKYQREWYKENKHKKVTRTKSKFEIQPNPVLVFD